MKLAFKEWSKVDWEATAIRSIGFTGSRRGMTQGQHDAVTRALRMLQPLWFHHGDCVGADAQAHAIAVGLGIPVHLHPGNLPAQRAYCEGAAMVSPELPPMVRNRDIVSLSNLIIATPNTAHEVLRSGTWSTVRHAQRNNQPVVIILPNGNAVGAGRS